MSRLRFYMKFAFSNLKKNKQIYLPQLVTSIGLTGAFYIAYTISIDEKLGSGRGGESLPDIMSLGVRIIGILSVILLLYTNSFLMKHRKRELGLFHVLGLEKRHVNGIMLMETLFTFVVSVVGGIFAGIVFYKLCILCICHLLKLEIVLGFYYIKADAIMLTIVLFLGIYFGICLMNSISVERMKPIELLKSDRVGEREPKTKWITLIIGLLTLGGGYGISLSVESPLKAIFLFFVAVLLVIIGTYCIFVAGSILILKVLKKSSGFYYHPTHMTAISGLLYRMKQNAVGLASICILSTAVIIMFSTTVNLYVGIEDLVNKNYPTDICITNVQVGEYSIEEMDEMLKQIINEQAEKYQVEIQNSYTQDYFMAAYHDTGKEFSANLEGGFTSDVVMCCFMTAEQYEMLTDEHVELSGNQVACYEKKTNTKSYEGKWSIAGDMVEIKMKLKQSPIEMGEYTLYNCLMFVVADDTVLQKIYNTQKAYYQNNASAMEHQYLCNLKGSKEEKRNVEEAVKKVVSKNFNIDEATMDMNYESKEEMREMYYDLNGSLLVLGIILGMVFLFVTVLIIYYKQISEGYEDRKRFQIMQKVGMTRKEVQKSIYSQIKLVFFSPLALALLHTLFAFPILLKLLSALSITNSSLFFLGIVFTYVVFGSVYFAIYCVTAKIYYKIVRL